MIPSPNGVRIPCVGLPGVKSRSRRVCRSSRKLSTPITMVHKTAVITGGTRGIGFAIAHCLAAQGFDGFVLGYNSDGLAARQATEALQELGAVVHCVPGDIAEKESMAALFEVVAAEFDNQLTAFVHNAGGLPGLTTERADSMPQFERDPDDISPLYEYYNRYYPQAFRRGIDLALRCEGLCHVLTLSNPGCNTSTSPRPATNEFVAIGKAAMELQVRIWATKLARRGVNVNCLIPGLVDVGGHRLPGARDWLLERVEQIPRNELLQPMDIGRVAAFLCSDAGSWLTGLSLPVDGGLHLVGVPPSDWSEWSLPMHISGARVGMGIDRVADAT